MGFNGTYCFNEVLPLYFINSLLTIGIVVYAKVCVQVIEKFSHFEKLVKVWVPRLWHFGVITKMEVVPDV